MNLEHLILQYVKIFIVIMGSVLTWLSLKGYLRSKKKGQLFLTIGFIFLTIGSGVEGLLYEIFRFDLLFSAVIESILVAIGLLAFIYAIYGNNEKSVA